MTDQSSNTIRRNRHQQAIWLFGICALLFLMIIVGGLTRLTDSGLSITEWKPVTGMIPPVSQQEWAEEFSKYQQIPEYAEVNDGMSLDDFKSIFWWEWGHRFLGRLIGFAFLLPFVFFAYKRRIERSFYPRLILMFVLGGAQGALGWYMVMSGLADRVDVSHYRLAAHLALAIFILGYIFWHALDLWLGEAQSGSAEVLRKWGWALMVLIYGQILLGALVAGLHAGLIYNSWPLMEGRWVPSGLFELTPAWLNVFENVKTVQFDHRIGAYLVVLVLGILSMVARKSRSTTGLAFVSGAVVVQIGLGVWTLLEVAPLSLSALHQAGAVIVFMSVVYLVNRMPRRQ